MTDYALGIDLGTTYVAAAVARRSAVEIVHLGNRATVIPSLVWVGEDGVLTGEAAGRRAGIEPQLVAREFKRRIGDSAPILLGGTPMSPQLLTSRLLEDVLDIVSERMGGKPSAIALTHPASWSLFKIDALGQAARAAGVIDGTFLTEPEAAARYHASVGRLQPGDLVVVYDLGGGTFDCTVGRVTERGFDVLGRPEGVEHLGGIDMDEAVFDHVLRSADGVLDDVDVADESVTAALSRLRRDCVEAKEALSVDDSAVVTVALGSFVRNIVVERSDIERAIRPLIDETVRTVRRALSSAGVEPAQLATVLLVGGASRMPIVAEVMTEAFGRPISLEEHPKHAIALGAALAAGESARSGTAPTGLSETLIVSSGSPVDEPSTKTASNETLIVPATPPSEEVPEEVSVSSDAVPTAPALEEVSIPTAAVPPAPDPPRAAGPTGAVDPTRPGFDPSVAPAVAGSTSVRASRRRRGGSLRGRVVGGVAVAMTAALFVVGAFLLLGNGDNDPGAGGNDGGTGPPVSGPSETNPTDTVEPESSVVVTPGTEAPRDRTCGAPPGELLFQSDREGLSDVYAIRPDGSTAVNLTNSPDWIDLVPVVSPDGTRFAFVTTRGGDFEISVADIDGSNIVQLTDNDGLDSNPTWSPDGARVAFDSDRSGDRELWVMNADGSDPQQVTDSPGSDTDPSWSPVDDRLVFNTDRFGSKDVAIIDLATGEVTAVTATAAVDEFHPDWSPDARTVSYGPDNDRIVLYDTVDDVHTDFPTPGFAKEASWSRDGCWLSFTTFASADDSDGEEIWIAPLDRSSPPVQVTDNELRDSGSSWGPSSDG